MARVSYVDEDDLSEDRRWLLDSSVPGTDLAPEYRDLLATDQRNVYRAMAHCPGALEQFRSLVSTLTAGDLPARECELVVLTVARTLDSRYVWHQHVRIALDEGVSPSELLAVSNRRYDEFPDDVAIVLQYVDRFVRNSVDAECHERLLDSLGERGSVHVSLLAGVYLMVARFLTALDVETEEPFVGWEIESHP